MRASGRRKQLASAGQELTSSHSWFNVPAPFVQKSISRYLALKKRRGHKKAIIAIARMLLTSIYNIVKKQESYNPDFYRLVDRPSAHREVSISEDLFILQRQGYLATAPKDLIFSRIPFLPLPPGGLVWGMLL